MKYLQPDNTIDVINPSLLAEYELFFGPILPGCEPLVLAATRTTDILMALGLAQSKGWCRKNSWDNPLPDGYSEIVFGSLRYKICILTCITPKPVVD